MLFVDWGCDPIFKMFFLWVSDDFPPPTLEGISFRMDRSGTPFKVPVHLRLARRPLTQRHVHVHLSLLVSRGAW